MSSFGSLTNNTWKDYFFHLRSHSVIPGRHKFYRTLGFPGHSVEPTCTKRRFNPWVKKIPWRRRWQPTPVFLPGKSHGQRSLVSFSPQGRKELHTAERLTMCACTDPTFFLQFSILFVLWNKTSVSVNSSLLTGEMILMLLRPFYPDLDAWCTFQI